MGIDYHELLVDKDDIPVTVTDEENFKVKSSYEKDIIMQVYQLCIDYIYWFTGSEGDTKSDKLLEHPMAEQLKFISNLYYLLDRSALIVSETVYYNLRKTITELDQVYHARIRPVLHLPQAWTDINPFLLSEEFDALVEPCASSFLDLLSKCYGFDEKGDKFAGEGYSDEIGHMLFEDIPDYHNMAEENRDHYDDMYESRCPDLLILMNDNYINDEYDMSTLVCREYANTLIKLMRERFPLYFKES